MVDTADYPQVYSASGTLVAVLNKAYDVIITDQIITDTNGSSVLNMSLPLDDQKQNLFDIEDEIHVAGGIFVIRTIQPGWDSQNKLATQIYAEAKWYDLAGFDPIQPLSLTGVTAVSVMTTLLQNTDWTLGIVDVSGTQDFSLTSVTNPLAAIMSMPPVFGGELEFDSANKTVSLRPQIGVDNGLLYAFGKNLQSDQRTVDSRNLYTRMRAYGANDKNNNPITISSVNSGKDYIENYSWYDSMGKPRKIKCYEQTNTKITDPTALKAWGQAILATLCQPKITYTMQVVIDKKYGIPNIGDTVRVYDPKLDLQLTNRVAQRNYNVLQPWMTTVQLSTALYTTASQTIQQQNDIQLQMAQQKSFLEIAVQNATDAITGQSGGYVVLNPANNPSEILIMDTPNINTAKNIWRWDSGGLGHSSNGYSGPYTTAITADGHIVADFIDTGILRAIQIIGVTISGSILTATGSDQGSTSATVTIGQEPSGTTAPITLLNSQTGNGVNIYGTGIGFQQLATGLDAFSNYIHSGFDVGDLSKENNVNIRAWNGVSISPSIDGGVVPKYMPVFSVNVRDGSIKNVGNIYTRGNISCLNPGGTIALLSDNEIQCVNQANTGFVAIRASAFNVQSIEKVKQDIKLMKESGMDIINAMDIYNYRLKEEVKKGSDTLKYGVVIGKGRRTPDAILAHDRGAEDIPNTLHIAVKALQETDRRIKKLESRDTKKDQRIAELESELKKLKEKIRK